MEKLQHELQAAQRTIAELQTRLEKCETECQLDALALMENRSAMLFMLEDLEAQRKKIEQAHHEWVAALDVVNDPIFLHDQQFRVMRCNQAYQQCAGMPYEQIIGRPYYEIFPKADAPLSHCLRVMDVVGTEAEEEEELTVGEVIYRSRASSIHDEQAFIYIPSTPSKISPRAAVSKERCMRAKKNSARLPNLPRMPSS